MAFSIKQNDRRPVFVVALKDNFGEVSEAPVNLTTAGTVFFNMRTTTGEVVVNRGTCTITDAASGVVTYAWLAEDTATAGSYQAECEVLWNDGKAESFPNTDYWDIAIVDDIA